MFCFDFMNHNWKTALFYRLPSCQKRRKKKKKKKKKDKRHSQTRNKGIYQGKRWDRGAWPRRKSSKYNRHH